MEPFSEKDLIRDGHCTEAICRECLPKITDSKCPNCRQQFPWTNFPEHNNIRISDLESEVDSLNEQVLHYQCLESDLRVQLAELSLTVIRLTDEMGRLKNKPIPELPYPKDLYVRNYKNKKGVGKLQLCLSDYMISMIKNDIASLDAYIKNL